MKSQLEKSLIESIGNENIKNITKDYGEILLDSLISDETLKSIPIINTVYNLTKAGLNLRDHLLMKKILQFLFETKSLGKEEKKKFIDKVNFESKYRTRVGEQLILILDRVDDLEKPIILGRLFKNVVNQKMSYETFLRLSSIIIRSFTPDILLLEQFNNGKNINRLSKESLVSQGLLSLNIKTEEKVQLTFKGIKNKDENELSYELNELSSLIIKYGLK